MVECPFCGSEVTEDLVTYGGTCPKCFAEIPGDEAPTDPGAEVRAAQERKDRRGRTFRIALLLSVLVALVFCTGGGAMVAFLWPEPEVAALLDFDELDIPLPDLVGPDAAGSVAAAPKPGPKPSPSSSSGIGSDPSASGSHEVRPKSVPGSGGPATTDVGTRPSPSPKIDLSLTRPVASRDDNLTLTDPEAIRMMIGERLKENIPHLKYCYEQRLKVQSTLKGRWLIKFTVQPNGKPTAVSASGVDRSDAELEQCMVRDIEKTWKFGKINVAQPVQRTLTLSP